MPEEVHRAGRHQEQRREACHLEGAADLVDRVVLREVPGVVVLRPVSVGQVVAPAMDCQAAGRVDPAIYKR